MVSSVEAIKALRVVITTLALVKPPRPLGRTELMAKAFMLKVSLSRNLYLKRREESMIVLKRRPAITSIWELWFSPLPYVIIGQRVDGLAVHIAGEAAACLRSHRIVESHIKEAEVRPLLGVLHKCGSLPRTCVTQHWPLMKLQHKDPSSANVAYITQAALMTKDSYFTSTFPTGWRQLYTTVCCRTLKRTEGKWLISC